MKVIRYLSLPIALFLTTAIFVLTPVLVRIDILNSASPGDESFAYWPVGVLFYSAIYQTLYLLVGIVAGVALRRSGHSELASGILIGTAIGVALGFVSCLIAAEQWSYVAEQWF